MSNPLHILLALALPAILLILALDHSVQFWKSRRSVIPEFTRKHWKSAALILAWFVFLVFDLPYLINQVADPTTPSWKFLLETFSGNWNPDAFPQLGQTPPATSPAIGQSSSALSPLARYQFSLAASVAFWLNNAVILGILGLIWKLAKERVNKMQFSTAWKLRDLLAQSAAEELAKAEFPDQESRDKVMKVFRKAQAQSMDELKYSLPAKDRETLLPILEQSTPLRTPGP
jgi:hypothetical protein